jgi:hypothetical protein
MATSGIPMSFLILVFFLSSLCLAQENPEHARESISPVVHCFHTADIDIIVLGTIGAAHAANPRFSWAYFDSIIKKSSPELLLVQIRPEHFNKQEFFDGAPEMAYLAYTARNMKIQCRGIDWWLDAQLGNWDLVSFDDRMAYIYRNIKAAIASTHAQVIMIAVDLSCVEPIGNYLVQDKFKEWSCPQAQFVIKRYPDLPNEVIEIFRDGTIYLASTIYVGSALVQRKIKDLGDIIKGKGYLFKRY